MKRINLISLFLLVAFFVTETTGQPVWSKRHGARGLPIASIHAGKNGVQGDPRARRWRVNQAGPTKGSVAASVNDGPSPTWVRHYINPTEPSHNSFSAIAFDRKGNVYAGGYGQEYPTQSALLCKYDSKGVVQWTVREKSFMWIWQLAVDSSGNIYAFGGSYLAKFGPQGTLQWLIDTCNAWVMALDSAGNVLAARPGEIVKYSPAGVPLWVAGSIDDPADIAVDRTGAVVVTGLPSHVTIKCSREGIEEWRVNHEPTGWGEAYLAVDASGAVYVSGSATITEGNVRHFTEKLGSDGVSRWLAETSGWSCGIGLDDSGNVLVAIYANGCAIVKYDSNGNQKWRSDLEVPEWSGPRQFCVDRSGNAYMTLRVGDGYTPTRIVRCNENGAVCWMLDYPDVGSEWRWIAQAVDASGNLFLADAVQDSAYRFTKAFLVTVDSTGIERWRATYEGPKIPVDVAAGIGVDSAGDVYVCGTTPLYEPMADEIFMGFFVLKYAPNGDLLWKQTGDATSWDGIGHRPEMIVSPDGSVVVLHGLDDANESSIALTSFDSQGHLQWSSVAHTPGFTWSWQKKGLLSDPQGNIYTVSTSGAFGAADSTTPTFVQKFSKNGVPLWSRDAPGRCPISAALDRAGNLSVLTIASSWYYLPSGVELPSVLRYDQSGHLDWTAQLDSLEESKLQVSAIASDDSGAVIVTGRVYNAGLTVKLDSIGAHQWIKGWEGLGDNESPTEIVVDHNGNVMVAGNTTIVSYSRDGAQRWVTTRPSGGSGIVLKRAPEYDARQLGAAFPIPPATISNLIVDKEGNTIVGYRGGGRNNDTPGAVKYSDSGTVSWAVFGVVSPYAIALDGYNRLYLTGGAGDIITVQYDLGAPEAIGSQASIPREYELYQNFPNPFNPSTTIKYQLPKSSEVRLTVYDMLGREVSVMVNERRDAGFQEVKFDGSNLASGVYFYRIQAGDFISTKKMLVLK